MKYIILLLLFAFANYFACAQYNSDEYWVNTSFGEVQGGGFGYHMSIDYEMKRQTNPASYVMGFTTGVYWPDNTDYSSSFLLAAKFEFHHSIFKWLDIYAGTIQGMDFKILGVSYYYDDELDEEIAYPDMEWNRWCGIVKGGIRAKLLPYLSLFGEVSGGSSAMRYSFGIGIRAWNY